MFTIYGNVIVSYSPLSLKNITVVAFMAVAVSRVFFISAVQASGPGRPGFKPGAEGASLFRYGQRNCAERSARLPERLERS